MTTSYELRAWSKSRLFYILALSFFFFTFLSLLGSGGYFDPPLEIEEPIPFLNSPYALANISFLLGKFFLFAVAYIAGWSLYKDFNSRTYSILYSYPLTKFQYLHAKLGSALIPLLFLSVFLFCGLFLAFYLLGPDNPQIGVFTFIKGLITLVIYLLPTIISASVLVFVSVGLTRNIFTGFIVVLCFILLQNIFENTLFSRPQLLALLDPFGQNTFRWITQDWSLELQNTDRLPINKILIFNRLFWLVLAALSYFIFYRKFDFLYHPIEYSFIKKTKTASKESAIKPIDQDTEISFNFSLVARLKAWSILSIYEFITLLKSWLFMVLSLFGIFTIFFIQLKASNTGAFTLLPFTRIFLNAPLSIYVLIIVFSTFIFSGLLTQKAMRYNMNELIDSTPVTNWQLVFSKIGSIAWMQLFQLLLFLGVSMLIQILNGYYHFELGLYFFHLFILVFPSLLIWNIMSYFIHALFSNIYFSLLVLIGLWMSPLILDQIGITTLLLKFNSLPQLKYSDLYTFGNQLSAYFFYLSYWFLLGILLLMLSILIWKRGRLYSIKERWLLLKSRSSSPFSISILVLFLGFSFLFFFIHKEERKDKQQQISKVLFEEYKKSWEAFSQIEQPKISEIDLTLDLFPKEQGFKAKAKYLLTNTGDQRIDTIFLRTGFDEITEVDWKGAAQLIKEDLQFNTYLYQLKQPLKAGSQITLEFEIQNSENTMLTRNSNILGNGTYLKQDLLPRLGYQFVDHELALTDTLANTFNYYHRDAAYVTLRSKLSTTNNQVLIAPGELVKKEEKEGRNYFHYFTNQPLKLNFSFHAGSYQVFEEKYEGVLIQIYYSEGHHHNIEEMAKGIKAALTYNQKYFGNYPYSQIRIIEFPYTESAYSATLAGNNIPTSELLFNTL